MSGMPVATSQRRRDKPRTLTQQKSRTGLLLTSPTLLIVILMVVVPLLWSILIAFQRLRLINIGRASLFQDLTLDNFRRVFASEDMVPTLVTTIVYAVSSTVLSIAIGLAAALALRRPFRGRTYVRALLLLPYVAPVVAVTFIWRIMLNPDFGIINSWGRRFFGWDDPIAFLSQASSDVSVFGLTVPIPTALLTVIVFEGWRYFPFAFLFIMARLQALSGEIEEAARVDGATPLQAFRYVILPQLMPVIIVLAVLRFIWTFNEFDDIFLLTGGAARTKVVSVRIYELLTVQRNVGAAAAQSVFLAIVLIVLLAIYARLLRARGEKL
jgi:multiple sugar transport system permease protein